MTNPLEEVQSINFRKKDPLKFMIMMSFIFQQTGIKLFIIIIYLKILIK